MTEATSASYGLEREIDLSYEEADRRIREELEKEGFGILTEIDVRATLKEKLDVDFPPYAILGACNPQLAHRALSEEPDIGLLLPCNVVVRVDGSTGRTIVEALDPVVQLSITGNEALVPLAEEVRERISRALDRVAGSGLQTG
jgi:uncharacterized protein (DUF302 family)